MFAHQTTEAWAALIDALFASGLSVVGTYPIETEMKSTALALGTASLESSITVVCRQREKGRPASFGRVRQEIEKAVAASVQRLWKYGFRGADLMVACYGPAIGVFGQHERVETAEGNPVPIPDLLEVAREAAVRTIAGAFQGDELSRLYFVWASQYNVTSQRFDDLLKVAKISIQGEDPIEVARKRLLFVVDGPKCRLALLRDRADRRHLGEEESAPLIDKLHHAMRLWQEEKRPELVAYLREHGLTDDARFWKLAQALFEVLPPGEEDRKLARVLLDERDTLRIEAGRKEAAPLGPLFNGQGAK